MPAPALEGFTLTEHVVDGVSKPLYRRGDGPAVIVMHEIPGITPQVAHFARRVADAGFSVWMPVLFGVPGAPNSKLAQVREIAKACIGREITVFARGQRSPLTDWLRGLCRHAHAACGGPGVGAIGMCITGNFALALMVDDVVMAPVLSQPSLPIGPTRAWRRDLAISDADLQIVKQRAAAGCPVIGLRFHGDPMCPHDRFERLRDELGEMFEGHELDPKTANPAGNRPPHSVVTTDLIDRTGEPTRAALDRVLEFFAERLRPAD